MFELLLKIKWSFNNKEISDNDTDYKVTLSSDVHMHSSKLIISKLNTKHSGVYSLTVKNPGGESQCSTQVNVKGTIHYSSVSP